MGNFVAGLGLGPGAVTLFPQPFTVTLPSPFTTTETLQVGAGVGVITGVGRTVFLSQPVRTMRPSTTMTRQNSENVAFIAFFIFSYFGKTCKRAAMQSSTT